MKRLVVLGSTGSIGKQTLDVVRNDSDAFSVVGLAVRTSIDALRAQVREFHPEMAVVYDRGAYEKAKADWPFETRLLCGMEGLKTVAALESCDVVVTAMVGMIGLVPTMEAIRARKTIALANKETLVCAGELVTHAAKQNNVALLPVDSEHCAIFQCMSPDVEKIILTASGGPFRTLESFAGVTKAQALCHPSWNMGAKITIDSATMFNKALEMIEARWLFDRTAEQIEVLIHPQSIVHSMVEMKDGTVLAQLALPDMRLPIQVALSYPARAERLVGTLNLAQIGTLTFEAPDEKKFVSLAYGREALKRGGLLPAVLNVANECAVGAFLNDEIGFTGIFDTVERALGHFDTQASVSAYTLEDVLALEREVRAFCAQT